MNFKKIALKCMTALLTLGAAMPAVTAQAQDKIIIGGNLELSGPAAAYGGPAAESLELLIEQVNAAGGILGGKQLEAQITDNKSDVTEATIIATALTTSEAVGVIGPTISSLAYAATPITNREGMPNLLTATTGDGVTQDKDGNVLDYLYRVCFADSYQGLAAGKYAVDKLGAKKAYIITDQALDYSIALADTFKQAFTQAGGEIVGEGSYQSGDTDFQALLTTLMGQDFDLLYIPGYYTETGLIIKQARELGIDQPIMGGDGYASETLVELAGAENMNQVMYTAHYHPQGDNEKLQQFIEAYEAKYNKKPDSFAALGYDAAGVLIDAIERAGSTDKAAIQKALQDTKNYEGVTGTFSFDDLHNPIKPALMLVYQDGEVASVEEAPAE